MSTDARQLDRRILAFIGSGGASEAFDRLAMDLFGYQYANNRVYRACCDPFCEPGRPRPRTRTWREIPAVWPVAWRLTELCCFDPAGAVAEFRSSGTTAGRARHLFDTLDLYRAALAGPFAEAMLPSPPGRGGGGEGAPAEQDSRARTTAPILVLLPAPDEAPDSSLSFMMGEAIERFGRPDASGFFVRGGAFLLAEFAEAIERQARGGGAVVLASTAFGWVTLLEWLDGRSLPLPRGSRLMETGGYKGRSAEWPRAELYARLARTFVLDPAAIVSEYGMCELSSQFYNRGSGVGGPPSVPGEHAGGPSSRTSEGRRIANAECVSGVLFHGPPWVRVLAIDPEALEPVPPGEVGLLRVIDLANRGSVIAVQTEDLAVVPEGCAGRTFELIGRAPAAGPKGCSLTAEDAWAGPA